MLFTDTIRNYVNALVGRNQEFDQLLKAHDITAVKSKMQSRTEKVLQAISEYDVSKHEIMSRSDKVVTNKKGDKRRVEKTAKLPIPYQVYINEVAVVFLYGQPVKWLQQSDDTDEAFAKFQDVIKRTRFDAKIRECKRLAGAETEAAMLFRVFKDEEGKADVQIRVLAASKGDEIYTRFDQYENLLTLAWGYYVREDKDQVVYHFDIFTKDIIYRCAKRALGWEVTEEINFIGKIPVILFQQEKEWAGVERLIEREESIASRRADTNDYFANPVLVLNADVIKNLPEKNDVNKTLVTYSKEGIDNAAKYLIWDNAPQSSKDEMEYLRMQILSKSFTPDITLETLKSVSQLSAKALRTVMMLADIKAARHKERHDEMLDRAASVITAIIGNVLEIPLSEQCRSLEVGHEFAEPFGDDVAEDINNILRCTEGGIMSEETAIELNPLCKDTSREKERLETEKEGRQQQQLDIFGGLTESGPQSYFDSNGVSSSNWSNTRPNTPESNRGETNMN